MTILTLRDSGSITSPGATVKGAPLTNLEVDNNFSNLNISIGSLESLTTGANSNIVVAVNEINSSSLSFAIALG